MAKPQNEQSRERRERRRKQRLCQACASPSFGKYLCKGCREKIKTRSSERKQRGICQLCSSTQLATSLFCRACANKVNSNLSRSHKTRLENHLCISCASPDLATKHRCQRCANRTNQLKREARARRKITGAELLTIINNAVPKTIPDEIRVDVCQEIALAVLSKKIAPNAISANVRAYIRQCRRFERPFYKSISLASDTGRYLTECHLAG